MDVTALIDHEVLVVNQKAKLIELTNEYVIRDEAGTQIGTVRQEGQSKAKKLLRAVTKLDQFMTHHLSVYDADGTKVAGLTRPRALLKSTVEVTDGSGAPVGRIVQQNLIGKIRFGLQDANGTPLGEIRGENWRAWDFAIVDTGDQEVGRITKKWAGLGRELFTTADNYVIQLGPRMRGPLRLLALTAGAAVDTALKQDNG